MFNAIGNKITEAFRFSWTLLVWSIFCSGALPFHLFRLSITGNLTSAVAFVVSVTWMFCWFFGVMSIPEGIHRKGTLVAWVLSGVLLATSTFATYMPETALGWHMRQKNLDHQNLLSAKADSVQTQAPILCNKTNAKNLQFIGANITTGEPEAKIFLTRAPDSPRVLCFAHAGVNPYTGEALAGDHIDKTYQTLVKEVLAQEPEEPPATPVPVPPPTTLPSPPATVAVEVPPAPSPVQPQPAALASEEMEEVRRVARDDNDRPRSARDPERPVSERTPELHQLGCPVGILDAELPYTGANIMGDRFRPTIIGAQLRRDLRDDGHILVAPQGSPVTISAEVQPDIRNRYGVAILTAIQVHGISIHGTTRAIPVHNIGGTVYHLGATRVQFLLDSTCADAQ